MTPLQQFQKEYNNRLAVILSRYGFELTFFAEKNLVEELNDRDTALIAEVKKEIKRCFAAEIEKTMTFGEPITWTTAQIENVLNNALLNS